jgi:flagellar biosynthesis protein
MTYFKRVRASQSGYGLPGPTEGQPGEPPAAPRPQAIALGYDPQKDPAPRLLAAGQGVIAEQILALARQQGIPIRNDPLLAAALATVQLDTCIPPELYQVVAEVLAYVYRLRGQAE